MATFMEGVGAVFDRTDEKLSDGDDSVIFRREATENMPKVMACIILNKETDEQLGSPPHIAVGVAGIADMPVGDLPNGEEAPE